MNYSLSGHPLSVLQRNAVTEPSVVAYMACSLVIGSLLVVAKHLFRNLLDKDGIPYKSGLPLIGSWGFWTRRYMFLQDGLRRFGDAFAFNVAQHRVVALSGKEARRVFFSSKHLSLTEGYRILFGGAPALDDIDVEKERDPSDTVWVHKRITSILRNERLAITLPLICNDLDRSMSIWGSSGTFNPFVDIYNLVFQLTIRTASAHSLADSQSAVARIQRLYWEIEHGSTPAGVMFPRIPNLARWRRNRATTELYELIKGVVEERQAGKREDDAVQAMVDEGDGVNDIVQLVMGILFAGIISTGNMSAWVLLFLYAHPVWKDRAIAELREFITIYATSAPSFPLNDESSSGLAAQLSAITPEVWDASMPVLDLCLRETIRIIATGAVLRRAMADIDLGEGRVVRKGEFLTIPLASTHLNAGIYTEPERWDPSRYERGEDKKEQWAYLGWGVGRHPCLGMRFAKLEVKLILAMFLTRYEYSVVDAVGTPVDELPGPDRDNLFQARPKEAIYIRYRKTSA